jgi:DNA-binding NtrC family response regulator
MTLALRARGLATCEAGDLRASLDAFERQPPGAVVVHWHPGAFELLGSIRSRSDVPALCVGVERDRDCVLRAGLGGATYFYTWPWDVERMIDDVAAILGGERRPTSRSDSHAVATADRRQLALEHRETLEYALLAARGNILEAAKMLGISRLALYRSIARHGIGREDPPAPTGYR